MLASDAQMAIILNCTEPDAVGLKRIAVELVTPMTSTHAETIHPHRRPRPSSCLGPQGAFDPGPEKRRRTLGKS